MAADSCVYVWRCDLDAEFTLPDSLDARERARAGAFKFERDRRRYIQAHRFLRFVLSSRLAASPAAIEFELSTHGKPRLAGRHEPAFNLSHADHVAYLAVMEQGPIGIDVELDHELEDAIEVGRSVYSTSEMDELTRADVAQRTATFLRCWTRKEAYLKALGLGIGEPDLPSITVGASSKPVVLEARADLGAIGIHIQTLDLMPGEYVAVATAHPFDRVQFTNLTAQ